MDQLRRATPTRFSATLTDSGSGEVGDPRELTFSVGRVGYPLVVYELSKGTVKRSGPGKFYVDTSMGSRGEWRYRWRAFGATITEEEVRFTVE